MGWDMLGRLFATGIDLSDCDLAVRADVQLSPDFRVSASKAYKKLPYRFSITVPWCREVLKQEPDSHLCFGNNL